MDKKKLEAMHKEYGAAPSVTCGKCIHLQRYAAGSRVVCKCTAYGTSKSSATDWSPSAAACGLFGVLLPVDFKPMFVEKLKQIKEPVSDIIDGHMSIDDFLGG